MKTLNKKIIVVLIILAVLSPIGIFLPKWLGAGDAWGEWSPETVKEQVGYTPKGMEKETSTWKALLPDYSNGNENNSPAKNALYYIISGIIGISLIAVITFGLYTFAKKRKVDN